MFSKTYPQVGATALLCRPVSSISNYVKAIIFIAFLSACSLKARSQTYYGGVQTIQMLHTIKERFKNKCPALVVINTEAYNLSKNVVSIIWQEGRLLVKSVIVRIVTFFGFILSFIGYHLQKIYETEFNKFYEKIRNLFRRKRNEEPLEPEDETVHEEITETRVEEKFENGRLSTRVNHSINRKIIKK